MKTKLYLTAAIIASAVLLFFWISSLVKNTKLKSSLKDVTAKYEQLLNAPKDTTYITVTDTFTYVKPIYITRVELQTDSIIVRDTIKDIEIVVPREQKTYASDEYRAVISGYRPELDSISVYQKTVTETVTKHIYHTKYKRFGIGVGIGASFDGKRVRPAVTAGIQYNILSF